MYHIVLMIITMNASEGIAYCIDSNFYCRYFFVVFLPFLLFFPLFFLFFDIFSLLHIFVFS